MKRLFLLSFATATIFTAACSTIDGMRNDLDSAFGTSGETNNTSDPAAKAEAHSPEALLTLNSMNKNCPQVVVVDELSALSEFTDMSQPKDYNLVSRVQVQAADNNCIYSAGTVRADVKLVFESVLGQRGKAQSNDRPFFSYPFFVAVTDHHNNILAKEVFAASMTYERDETRHTYYENLRQIIPLDNRMDGPKYKIMVGFQLTDEQLAYNRRTMALPTHVETMPQTTTMSAPEPQPQDPEGGDIINLIKNPQDQQAQQAQ